MGANQFVHILAPSQIADLSMETQYNISSLTLYISFIYLGWVGVPRQKSYGLKAMHHFAYSNNGQNIGQTWLPVSMLFNWLPLVVFQKRMQRSAVPPPDARRPLRWGDQVMALTAAVCSVSFRSGFSECWFHTNSWVHHWKSNQLYIWQKKYNVRSFRDLINEYTWLSLPPDASSRSSWDHFRPHA